MKVLVVDDSRAMRMIVGRELREVPLVEDCCEADSAEAAVEVLGATPIDLVVCDWNMGGMSGLELLQALRTAGWGVPFGFVTSERDETIVEQAMAAGAAFVLAKPFRPDELREKVAAVLSGATPAARRAAAVHAERPEALQRLLEELLRRPVQVVQVAEGPPRQSARWTARYVDGTGRQVALCVVEMPLALAMSAALTMMPPSSGTEWASSGALPDALAENLHEVTNVMATAVQAGGARCTLSELAGFAPGEQLPGIEQIRAASSSESFEVDVEGYGAGRLSLVVL